ncbi:MULTISPECIES: TetR/AcrR family transcriptional regulator [Bifidobacterium]|jgi:AcrR family transcriptional regulator|nr:TetR/AcrR family transcriptional regulator [Bifidobacterium tibiigranuli]
MDGDVMGDGSNDGARGRPVNAALTPAIMEAVQSLLADGGYARLTTAAVAKRAGVSTATLYRRWPSKRDLLLAAARQVAASETADIDTGSTENDLREMFDHKQRLLAGGIGATLVAVVGESVHDHELATIVRTGVLEPTQEHLKLILRRAEARGECLSADADAAANLVLGVLLARIAFPDDRDSGSPLLEDDVEMLIRAITTPVQQQTGTNGKD